MMRIHVLHRAPEPKHRTRWGLLAVGALGAAAAGGVLRRRHHRPTED